MAAAVDQDRAIAMSDERCGLITPVAAMTQAAMQEDYR